MLKNDLYDKYGTKIIKLSFLYELFLLLIYYDFKLVI